MNERVYKDLSRIEDWLYDTIKDNNLDIPKLSEAWMLMFEALREIREDSRIK